MKRRIERAPDEAPDYAVGIVRQFLIDVHVYCAPRTIEQISHETGLAAAMVEKALATLVRRRDPFGLFHTCDKPRLRGQQEDVKHVEH
jgi:hypothetical protein